MSLRTAGWSRFRRIGPALGVALVAAFAFSSCDKEKPRDEVPSPGPRPAPEVPLGPEVLLAPDTTPSCGIAWLAPDAWEAAKPAGFKLIYFRTPREFGCGLLERYGLPQANVAAYLKANAAARLADPDRDGTLARRLGVSETPTLAVFDPDGGYAGAIVGFRPFQRLLQELKELAAKAETQRQRARELDAKLSAAPNGPARIDALDAAAEVGLERRRYAEAEKYLRELLAQPGVEQARALSALHGRHAQALAELGRLDEADAAFGRAIASDVLKVYGEELAFKRAQTLTFAGKFPVALERWEAFLRDYPQSKRAEAAAFNRVFTLAKLGRKDEALRVGSDLLATAKDPDTTGALRMLLFASLGESPALQALELSDAERQATADALLDGREIVRKHGCTDCHLLIEPEVRPLQQSCVECHLLVRKLETEQNRHEDLLKAHPHFFRNCTRIRHLLRAPSLFGVGARVRASWIRKFLESPYDIRPHLEESMIQVNLEPAEMDTLVRYFRAIATTAGQEPPREDEALPGEKPSPERIERGRELFVQKHCFVCHQFGNTNFGPEQGTWNAMEGRAEAPNLRYARERLVKRTAALWIRDPAAMSPGTRMPRFELSEDEVISLVDFIFHGDLGQPAPAAEPTPRIKLSAVPTWEEVNAAVFQDTCVHCHQEDSAGGAGNTGAYGYRGRRLDLTSYAGLKRGSLQADGTRLDILTPREGGLPPLILERVQRRVEENARDKIEPFRDPLTDLALKREGRPKPGMPLGHPALTPEQRALLEAWVKGGAPGPAPAPLGDPTEKKKPGME